jgi:membrane complex biogenesis BtpA family protein
MRVKQKFPGYTSAMKLFPRPRALIGMLHLLPLPGSPDARGLDEVRRAARADADALARGGVDGILVENYGDAPFGPGPVEPQVLSAMSVLAAELRAATRLPLGINVLRNDARGALAVALAAGASFIRVNVHVGAAETDQGRIDGRAHETLRYRRAIGSKAAIFADVFVKHARSLTHATLAAAARDTAYRGKADALLVTGPETGSPTEAERVRVVAAAVPDRPVYVASGITIENVNEFPEAAGYIVGSSLEKGGRAGERVELRRVRALVRAIKGR